MNDRNEIKMSAQDGYDAFLPDYKRVKRFPEEREMTRDHSDKSTTRSNESTIHARQRAYGRQLVSTG